MKSAMLGQAKLGHYNGGHHKHPLPITALLEGARRTSPTYTPGDCGFQGCPLEVAKGQGVTFNTGDREREIYI